MTAYAGRHAELYDLFYADKPYAQEASFVHELLRKHAARVPRRVLDVACGTGRHAFELEKLGYEVWGVDQSPDMLDHAKRRAEESESSVHFELGDMRNLDPIHTRFDAAVCLFDSLGYVVSNAGVHDTLSAIRRRLEPDGLLVLEVWHAPAILRGFERVRVRRLEVPGGQVLRIAETELDVGRQCASVRYSLVDLRDDGTWRRTEETQVNRYFLVPDLEAHLETAGFEAIAWFGGLHADAELSEHAFHAVGIARRVELA